MLELLHKRSGILLLGLLFLAACATTQIGATWKDPSYRAQPAKIMVIVLAKEELNRKLFEDEFALQFKSHGVDAIASYTVLSDKQQGDQAAIASRMKELGVDTMLITRLVDKKTVKVYTPGAAYYPPPYYGAWPDYYGLGYRYLYSPGYFTENQYLVMETNLYETRHDKLVWSASSETLLGGSDVGLIKSFIKTMVQAMAESGLLSK